MGKSDPVLRVRSASATACAMVMAATAGMVCGSTTDAVNQMERYCATSWRNARIDQQDWNDCTQEAFVRMLQRVDSERLDQAFTDAKSEERRELNRSIWATIQKWRRAPGYFSLAGDVPERSGRQEPRHGDWTIEDVRAAISAPECKLTAVQREILSRWSDGHSVSEIASSLKWAPARVSDEKYKALVKLRNYFTTCAAAHFGLPSSRVG